MKVSQEKVALKCDERGFVLEPLGMEHLSCQRNTHLVVTLPGFVRGNHLHRKATERVVVLGPALVRFREDGATRDVSLAEGEAVRFTFPAGVPHAIQHTGVHPGILMAFSDAVHDPDLPDAVREILIEP